MTYRSPVAGDMLSAAGQATSERTSIESPGGRDASATAGRAGQARRVRVVTIPSTDLLFARLVAQVDGSLGLESPRRLALHLRALFPRLVVHRRDLSGESVETWYVFRDGRLTVGPDDGWWRRDEEVSRARVDWDGALHDATAEARALFRLGPDEHVTLASIAPTGTEEELAVLLTLARGVTVVDTVIALRARDGERHIVAIHGDVRSDGIDIALRPLPRQPGEPRVAPICLPAWDDMFIERVERLAEHLVATDPDTAAARLELRLRQRYPSAIVRRGPESVDFGTDTVLLLVYRDGERSPYAVGRWWEQRDVARIVTIDGTATEVSPEAEVLFGRGALEIMSANLLSFHAEEARDDERWLGDILIRTGQLHATTWLVRGDGEHVPVEVHAEHEAAERRTSIALRRIDEAPPDRQGQHRPTPPAD
ncbi:MAG TPA: hypothetical protein VF802_06720 [Candidatus Limnocylindrales bacterium]